MDNYSLKINSTTINGKTKTEVIENGIKMSYEEWLDKDKLNKIDKDINKEINKEIEDNTDKKLNMDKKLNRYTNRKLDKCNPFKNFYDDFETKDSYTNNFWTENLYNDFEDFLNDTSDNFIFYPDDIYEDFFNGYKKRLEDIVKRHKEDKEEEIKEKESKRVKIKKTNSNNKNFYSNKETSDKDFCFSIERRERAIKELNKTLERIKNKKTYKDNINNMDATKQNTTSTENSTKQNTTNVENSTKQNTTSTENLRTRLYNIYYQALNDRIKDIKDSLWYTDEEKEILWNEACDTLKAVKGAIWEMKRERVVELMEYEIEEIGRLLKDLEIEGMRYRFNRD